PRRGAKLLEEGEARLERLARSAFLASSPRDGAERKQRACAPEGISGSFMLRDRVLEKRGRRGNIPPGSLEKPAAASDIGERPLVIGLALGLPGVEDSQGFV